MVDCYFLKKKINIYVCVCVCVCVCACVRVLRVYIYIYIYILPPLIQVSKILCFTTDWFHKPWSPIRVGSNIITDIHNLPIHLLQRNEITHRFSQALKRSSHFFSRTSQEHNALPRPGLEPGSSDSEPSTLTTGLLNKVVALACPRYSWPRMLKVAPCMVIRSYGRTVLRSYIQIFSAWWVTTVLYNYGATLCELRYQYKYCLIKTIKHNLAFLYFSEHWRKYVGKM